MADEPLSLALKRGHMDCAELLVSNVRGVILLLTFTLL